MSLAQVRLLHLVSPVLPVGAYTYSQGLEAAIDQGAVHDEASALDWIGDALRQGVARAEAVYLAHMLQAWETVALDRLRELNEAFLANRETAELRAETLQMGYSLARLLADLPGQSAGRLAGFEEVSLPLAWSLAAVTWAVPVEAAVEGYLWAWLENQVMAAVKAVPLGQTSGQRLLAVLGTALPAMALVARRTPIEDTHNWLPALAIASSRHETQYTRLFRS